jgi:FkbM family methyltransferase
MMFNRLGFWKTKGMNPTVIYDIGANNGDWTRQAMRIFPSAHYEQFEANSQHARPGRHMVLLGETEKEATFYKAIGKDAGGNTGASMYLEVTKHYTPGTFVEEKLQVIPLDLYIERNNIPYPEFMKIDVQGAELDILRGAKKCMETTKYILMEVSLHMWNRGAPMIEEVISYMASCDFELIDIVDTHFVGNYLFQIDVIFAHKSTGLRKQSFYSD